MKRKKVMSILLIIGMMSGLCGCGDYQSKQITVPPSDDEEEQEKQEEPDTESKADIWTLRLNCLEAAPKKMRMSWYLRYRFPLP